MDSEYVSINNFPDYEILNKFPFTVRRKDNQIAVTKYVHKGCWEVKLNRISCQLHRLIALQFIPNDDPVHNKFVKHINGNNLDNHLDNIRWGRNREKNDSKTNVNNYF